MHDHVRGRCVFHAPPRTPALALGFRRASGNPGPQGPSGRLLCQKAGGPHESVAINGAALAETHAVDHAVTIEGVIHTNGIAEGIFSVAYVQPVQILRDLTDHLHVCGNDLVGVRGPGASQIRVIRWAQLRFEVIDERNGHGRYTSQSIR